MSGPTRHTSPQRTRALLRGGAIAGPLFAATFLIEGVRRPDYDPRRHPVSSLALGPHGWTQTANFVATGILVLGGAAGLHQAAARNPARRSGIPSLVTAAGMGLIASAALPTDPVSGYPPGTPPIPEQPTRHGTAHGLVALPIFLGLPAAAGLDALRAARTGHPMRAICSTLSGLGMLATTRLFGAGFEQQPRLIDHAGLLQRISIALGFGWLTGLCTATTRQLSTDNACRQGTR